MVAIPPGGYVWRPVPPAPFRRFDPSRRGKQPMNKHTLIVAALALFIAGASAGSAFAKDDNKPSNAAQNAAAAREAAAKEAAAKEAAAKEAAAKEAAAKEAAAKEAAAKEAAAKEAAAKEA